MESDEQQIRELVRTWMTATQAGDIDRVLDLMTDDVVFLTPGREPMRKHEFAGLARLQPGQVAPKFEGKSDVQEIQVIGDWAYMWTKLMVAVTPAGEVQPIMRSGHTLSILRKQNGKWLLARDANMLTMQPAAQGTSL